MASVKTIDEYRKYYPFEAPHKIFLDKKFIEYMIRFEKSVEDISHVVGDKSRLFTTSCVKKDISMLQRILDLESTQSFLFSIQDVECVHDADECLSSQDCITSMFSNGNPKQFFVATINKELETMLLEMRTVPVIGLNEANIILRNPVAASKELSVVESSWDRPVDYSDNEKKLSKKERLKKLLTSDDGYMCQPTATKRRKHISSVPFIHEQRLTASEDRAWVRFKSRWRDRVIKSNRKRPSMKEWLKSRKTLDADDVSVPSAANEKKLLRNKSLFLSNLQFKITEQDLFTFFEDAGKIVAAKYAIINDKFAGYALIDFATYDDALKALELSGYKLLGRVVKIEAAEDKASCLTHMDENGGEWVCSAVFKELMEAYDARESSKPVVEADDSVKSSKENKNADEEKRSMSKRRKLENKNADEEKRSMSKRRKLENENADEEKRSMSKRKLERAAHKDKKSAGETWSLTKKQADIDRDSGRMIPKKRA